MVKQLNFYRWWTLVSRFTNLVSKCPLLFFFIIGNNFKKLFLNFFIITFNVYTIWISCSCRFVSRQGRILFFPFDGKLNIQIAGISFNIEYLQNPPDESNDICQKFDASLKWNFNSKIFGGPLELTYVKTTTDLPKDRNICLGNSSFVTKYADIKGNGERCLYGVMNIFKINIEALGFLWSSKLGFKTTTAD